MPRYDYVCESCANQWEASHGFNDPKPDCPVCGSEETRKLITSAPTFARGVLTPAGTARKQSKEQLKDKWAEETPKLRKQLENKLGKDMVQKNAPHLYNKSSAD